MIWCRLMFCRLLLFCINYNATSLRNNYMLVMLLQPYTSRVRTVLRLVSVTDPIPVFNISICIEIISIDILLIITTITTNTFIVHPCSHPWICGIFNVKQGFPESCNILNTKDGFVRIREQCFNCDLFHYFL